MKLRSILAVAFMAFLILHANVFVPFSLIYIANHECCTTADATAEYCSPCTLLYKLRDAQQRETTAQVYSAAVMPVLLLLNVITYIKGANAPTLVDLKVRMDN